MRNTLNAHHTSHIPVKSTVVVGEGLYNTEVIIEMLSGMSKEL